MSHNTSTCVSSQNRYTHYNDATTSRLPLSEIQNVHSPIHVNTWKSQALLQSAKPLTVKFEDSVSPRNCHSFAGVSRESARSTPRTRANHIKPKLQTTPILHQDTTTDPQFDHNQASSPSPTASSNTLHSKPSSSKSVSTSNRCLDSLSLPKAHFTLNTRHSKPYRLQVTRPRSKLIPSSKPRAQGSRVRFPDPHKEPPDSYAAALWRHVRARIATMEGPSTATTPSNAAPSASESNSKLDQTFKDLEIDHGVQCDPQFTTIVSTENAPAIVSMLRSETKEGSTALNLLCGIESAFFRQSESNIKTKRHEAWTINHPNHEQLVIHGNHTIDQELDTASISFSLAADATWNNKFRRGVPGLLRSTKVFDASMRCSQFLIVTAGSADLDSLHEQ